MRGEYWHYVFWLLIIGSWVLGVAYGRWGGGDSGFFADLGKAVSVPPPAQLSLWQPIPYFILTVIAAFLLSQVFFGAAAAIFLFARGVCDVILFRQLEQIVGNWTLTSIQPGELWSVFFIMLVLTVNLPLCIWAAHMGTQRATRMWYRLKGKPIKPETGVGTISNMLMAVTASLAIGLFATFALSYA